MGYEQYVEIRTGNLEINGQDVGNVKLFTHAPAKETHEIIGGNTNGVIDTKEFVAQNGMKLTCDRHTYERIAKLFGLTPVITTGVNDAWLMVAAEDFILTGDFYLGNYTLLDHGRASENPIDIEVIQLTFQAAGYVNAVPGDIGLQVLGAVSNDTGDLMAYDNVNRIWLVHRDTHADVYQAEAVTIPLGTGAGTIAAAGDILPGGFWPDALQAGAEWVEGVDFELQPGLGAASRLATGGMADPETVYGWYAYVNAAAATMNFPLGSTQITTRAEFIYTKTLQNGRTQEIKIPDGYIVNFPEISKAPDALTEYSFEIKSVEKSTEAGAEHGYDKRTL